MSTYDEEMKLHDLELIMASLSRLMPHLKEARFLASSSYAKKAEEFWQKIVNLQGVANELITEVEKEARVLRTEIYGPDEEE